MAFAQIPETIILLPFAEPQSVRPSDAAGTLEDLAGVAGQGEPTVVDSWTGVGRSWSSDVLVAVDKPNRSSLLNRNVTVQALLQWSPASVGVPGTLICRGTDGTTPELWAFSIQLTEQSTGIAEVRWSWMDSAGDIKTQAPGVFAKPAAGTTFLLTCTRRWESTTRVVCRYYVDERMVAETVSAHGDIAGGTTGTTSIGARKDGGTWGDYYPGVIDELKVTNYEMSPEEVQAVWRRLAVHQPAGEQTFNALAPPGAPWNGPNMAALKRIAGQLAGLVQAKGDELLQNWLPDRAYLDLLPRWERLTGVARKAFDSLDLRRQRVASFMQRDNGYTLPLLTQTLAAPLAADAADIEIIEPRNFIDDTFAALSTERWTVDPVASWSIVSGTLQLNRAAGVDMRHDANVRVPCHARTPIPAGVNKAVDSSGRVYFPGAETLASTPDGSGNTQRAYVRVKLATYWAALPLNTIVGLFMHNRRSGNALWFGVRNDGGTRKLGWQSYKDGVLGAFQVISNPSTDAAYWLTLQGGGPGNYNARYSLSSFNDSPSSVIAGVADDLEWCGVGAMCTDAASAAILTATFDDFGYRFPGGDRSFRWFAYRNPALPGIPDMIGANALLRTLKPAHTEAYAIQSRSVLCDDATNGGCDGGPMGGI